MNVIAASLPGKIGKSPGPGVIENDDDPLPVIASTVTIRALLPRPVFSIVSVFNSEAGLPFFKS